MSLREIVSRRQAVLAPGAANALFARIIEDLGFECVYVTGAGIANMALGAPDIGLTSLDDIAGTVARIADAVDLPLIVDADTGFGNAVNTWRTMKVLERAGAAAIQLEDQDFPKRCGHFNGKGVIALSEMLPKIAAAADARTRDTLIIARTDALAVEGIDAAIDRAQAFIAAGADMTFIEAPRDAAQMRRIAQVPVPQVANIVHGGKTPPLPQADLAEMGFGIVLYANAALQAAVRSATEVLGSLKATGSLDAVHDRLASFEERQAAVAKDRWDAREQRFKAEV
ncbi:oxaloacetate decarboxylase [Novosphingobium sp. Fuku2-ISO-50]|uniref:isocitrate lyase/PEP mutase family protein n=1 Tax=Novosphingobium sp. Fuku2-ISO-50 TaxID=1739114 RepID=UPI00076D6A79|nr:isocitrate lyase/phosphoenolpyruvate mutase family protein [Novosphingobium sp. Fuku2-ISO-50]KUR76785.1 carboxyvinyl-carboxyphosphonate phosphorylmutase [Novosphingobium sp. Fuku2-ISO-50]